MIESIHIAGIATYGSTSEVMGDLSEFNFLYGANGSGKTTITRVIADEEGNPTCKVTWKGGTRLEALVYNRDFVAKNFNPSSDLKGVFTLGEKNIDTIEKIAAAKGELDVLTKKIETLTVSLSGVDSTGGKKGELAALEEEFKIKCWAQKKKLDGQFSSAFEGLHGSTEKFKAKALLERTSNSAPLKPLADLEKRAETIFGPTPTTENAIPILGTTNLAAHESNPILKKRVIGKDDVDIAAMIKKLGNSDWVREGRGFLEINDKVCPFCQQITPDEFTKSLNDYFDETFEKESKAIVELETNYKTDSARLQQEIETIIAAPSKFFDVEILKAEKALLDSKIALNVQRIATKRKEPSQSVELESLANVFSTTKAFIDAANVLIADHNKMVANLVQERRDLTAQVWKYFLDVELKTDFPAYETKRDGFTKGIEAIAAQIAAATIDKATKTEEIRALEKETTSIQPTIDAINRLLASFGFRGFSLAKTKTGTSYKLIRANGTDAKETLSEGEMSFVTFLYFYHLLKGSASESGMTTDRVVVFDDPVSSLDSDILFIVGSLIKGLFDEVRAKTGHIKQIFVFTHNVYFHKEVTFHHRRRVNDAMTDETFWTVRKIDLLSKLEKHISNPIKTSYELLWAEVRRPDFANNITAQNTLRRIVENYFRILGGINPDAIIAMFEGKEMIICKSLFSWVNDGSHSVHDDLFIAIDGSMVETYLKVFESIFEKSNHHAHFKMMMGNAYVGSEPAPTST